MKVNVYVFTTIVTNKSKWQRLLTNDKDNYNWSGFLNPERNQENI